MSKGSNLRPIQDRKKFDENWNRIFGSKKDKQPLDKKEKQQ